MRDLTTLDQVQCVKGQSSLPASLGSHECTVRPGTAVWGKHFSDLFDKLALHFYHHKTSATFPLFRPLLFLMVIAEVRLGAMLLSAIHSLFPDSTIYLQIVLFLTDTWRSTQHPIACLSVYIVVFHIAVMGN